jgi:hypothetical protein
MFKYWKNEEISNDFSIKSFTEILNSNWYNIAIFIFSILIITATIVLNLFIIIIVIIDKSMRNYTNIQFASVSLADLLVGIIAMPLMVITQLYLYWPLGADWCIMWCIGDFVGGNVSIIW